MSAGQAEDGIAGSCRAEGVEEGGVDQRLVCDTLRDGMYRILIVDAASSDNRSFAFEALASAVTKVTTLAALSEAMSNSSWSLGVVLTGLVPMSVRLTAQLLRNSGQVARVAILENASETGATTREGMPGNADALWLDQRNRRLMGVEAPLLAPGEMVLLRFLGMSPMRWYSCQELSKLVYERTDATAQQLVWKYASTLRKKLLAGGANVLEAGRGRGYRSTYRILVCDS
jgi:hypothetical protein